MRLHGERPALKVDETGAQTGSTEEDRNKHCKLGRILKTRKGQEEYRGCDKDWGLVDGHHVE